MQATLSFPEYATAKAFAHSWAFFSLRGYSLSPKDAKGGATLTLDGLSPVEIEWINGETAKLNGENAKK